MLPGIQVVLYCLARQVLALEGVYICRYICLGLLVTLSLTKVP